MNSQSNSLFSELSPQAASQSKGGHGCCYSSCYSVSTVRVRYYPVSSSYYRGYGSSYGYGNYRSVNITNPNFDDGSIVNF